MKCVLYLSLLCVLTTHAFGFVVITVDISNPSAVTFTATDNNSTIDAGLNSIAGISLIDFLPGNTQSLDGDVDSGSMDILDTTVGSGTRIALDRYYSENGSGYSLLDLSFYSLTNHNTEVSTTEPALTGVLTLDLNGLTLPASGSSGSVTMGSRSFAGTHTFGTYNVVPEPGAFAAIAGLLGLLYVSAKRWRNRKGL